MWLGDNEGAAERLFLGGGGECQARMGAVGLVREGGVSTRE